MKYVILLSLFASVTVSAQENPNTSTLQTIANMAGTYSGVVGEDGFIPSLKQKCSVTISSMNSQSTSYLDGEVQKWNEVEIVLKADNLPAPLGFGITDQNNATVSENPLNFSLDYSTAGSGRIIIDLMGGAKPVIIHVVQFDGDVDSGFQTCMNLQPAQ